MTILRNIAIKLRKNAEKSGKGSQIKAVEFFNKEERESWIISKGARIFLRLWFSSNS